MNIKKIIEGNPILSLTSIVVAAVSITSAVLTYFSNQNENLQRAQYEQKITDCESKLASINRGMAGSEYYDVRTLMIFKDQPTNIPTDSKFFSEDQFYASTDQSQWLYSKTTENELARALIGSELPAEMQNAIDRFPIHLWKAKSTLSIKDNDVFKNLFAFLLVQRVPIKELRGLSEKGASMMPKDTSDTQRSNVINKLEEMYHGDVIGTFLTIRLSTQMSAEFASQNTNYRLTNIQKVGNVVYARTLITLKNAIVDNKLYPFYYITTEWIYISTPTDVYAIITFIPNQEPSTRGPLFASVTKWLTEVRILL